MLEKRENSEIYIYGRQPVLEALRADHPVYEIWLGRGISGAVINKIEKMALTRRITIKRVDKNQIQKWTGPVVHQGVAARIKPFILKQSSHLNSFLENKSNPFLLILDQVQDPHNLGAILRSAEACGVELVIIPEKGSAPLNSTVAKTSAGAVFHMSLMQCEDLIPVLEILNSKKLSIVATLPEKGQLLPEIDLTGGIAIVIGSEGKGVRKNLWSYCTQRAAIPQKGRVNSFNASVAAGIVLYEAVRQRLISGS